MKLRPDKVEKNGVFEKILGTPFDFLSSTVASHPASGKGYHIDSADNYIKLTGFRVCAHMEKIDARRLSPATQYEPRKQ